jgi:DeoR family glycerol-3-phosphate regulon repressor
MALSTRQKKIINQLHEVNGILSSADITALFNVTIQTIRKDLNELSELGLVRRVHGGISLPSSNQNVSFSNRTVMNLSAKQNIARKVVELLPENSSIFLGIGTTPQQVAVALLDHPGLTVVTNNINVALTLCHNANIQTHLAGGKVRINDQDLMGSDTTDFMAKFNIQYGVFGVGGLNQKGQLLDFSPEESHISRTIIDNSATRILVVDHTKFERYAPVISGVLNDIDYLIMDIISEPIYELCKDLDIEVFEVGPNAGGEAC